MKIGMLLVERPIKPAQLVGLDNRGLLLPCCVLLISSPISRRGLPTENKLNIRALRI